MNSRYRVFIPTIYFRTGLVSSGKKFYVNEGLRKSHSSLVRQGFVVVDPVDDLTKQSEGI